MNLTATYQGRSGLETGTAGQQSLRLAPNLNRDAVAFDAALRQPLRFREAMSALHDVVVSDLRFKPRDREAYEQWKRAERQREAQIRAAEYQRLKQEVLAEHPELPEGFEQDFNQKRKRYWKLRDKYGRRLWQRDPQMWRLLVPCDPVVTVADDVMFFECFSADQSSYGCLTLDREDALGTSTQLELGTTNVDYSWALYDHFQTLRSYRETRLAVDPEGFSAKTSSAGEHREEKIDLPEGWLRGFMQVQSAMTLPMRKVTLSREALYSILAWHRRHKARKSPRAMRFELTEGESPRVVLEPWEQIITSHGTKHAGESCQPIRVWGVRRLLSLARVLPLVDRCDVYLLGTGLPSFWVVRMGEMRLTLGLSGWTANDWSAGAELEMLAPPGQVKQQLFEDAASLLQKQRAMRLDELQASLLTSAGDSLAILNRLAYRGQVIHDLAERTYRWRQVMPMPLGREQLGSDSEELRISRTIVQRRGVKNLEQDARSDGRTALKAKVDGIEVELTLDQDHVIRSGKCSCSHHHRAGIRRGPCAHLLAARSVAIRMSDVAESKPGGEDSTSEDSTMSWYNRLIGGTGN